MNPTPRIFQYTFEGQRRVGGTESVHFVDKNGLAKVIDDMILLGGKNRDIMRLIGARLRAMQHEHFTRQEDIGGSPWPDLSASTIASRMPRAERAAARKVGKAKAREYVFSAGGFPMLRDTGRLQNSIQMSFDDDSTHVGTNLVYGPTHQFGDPRRNIPARMFLYCNERESSELVDMLSDYRIRAALMGAVHHG